MFNKSIGFVFLFLAVSVVAQIDHQKGLVAYYPFSGSTADSSGNGHDGINHGAVLTVDRYGEPNSAYYFNGSDTCMIEIPDHPDFNFHDSLTFILWYRYDNFNKHPRSTLFNKGGDDTSGYWGFRRYDFGEFSFYNYPDAQWSAWLGQQWQNLEDGNWHWLAIRFHSKGYRTYVDGQIHGEGSSSSDSFLANSNKPLIIGNVLGITNRGWAGEIDEVRFYNRFLGHSEITRLYDNPTDIIDEEKLTKEFKLYQNYPNPFNPITKIKYEITRITNVKLVVYDILGREIETLIDRIHKPGSYEIKFDGTGLSGGTYIYKLIAGNFVKAKSLVLLK